MHDQSVTQHLRQTIYRVTLHLNIHLLCRLNILRYHPLYTYHVVQACVHSLFQHARNLLMVYDSKVTYDILFHPAPRYVHHTYLLEDVLR